MEIYVGNIPPSIKVEELRFLYQSYGHILFVDIKNRCKPPFAFILFDNSGSAYNAAANTNGYQYQGYQFQVKLLTPDDNCNDIIDTSEKKNEIPEPVAKIVMKIPEKGPGSLEDKYRKGLSKACIRWYLRYLEDGIKPKEARIKAETHKFIASGNDLQSARKKAEKNFASLFNIRTLKVLK